jgi:hypothetical protein
MDTQVLVVAVMEKFREAGGYTDLDDKALYKSIKKAIDYTYQKNFYETQKRIKDDERRGIFPDEKRYEKDYTAVEDVVFAYANKLAATQRGEI